MTSSSDRLTYHRLVKRPVAEVVDDIIARIHSPGASSMTTSIARVIQEDRSRCSGYLRRKLHRLEIDLKIANEEVDRLRLERGNKP